MTDLEWIRKDAEEALRSAESDPMAAIKILADCVVRLTHVIEGMRRTQDGVSMDQSPFRRLVS